MIKALVNKDVQEFSKKITDFLEVRSFLTVYEFVLKSGVCPETDRKEWFNTLVYMHTKGWLYLNTENGKIDCVAGAYRVKDLENLEVMPEVDEGDILFVPFAASVSDNRMALKTMLDKCLKQYPDIKEVAFYEQASNQKLKRFKVTEGVSDGWQ